jgi:hypothetical protein
MKKFILLIALFMLVGIGSVSAQDNIKCYNDDDCPSVTGDPYCQDDLTSCGTVATFRCNNPGTPEADCVSSGGGTGCKVCLNGCEDGECTPNDYKKGAIKGAGASGQSVKYEDSCGVLGDEKFNLIEYFCDDTGNVNRYSYECPGGCKNGECIEVTKEKKGYRNAYWQCYDGFEEKSGGSTSCKPSEIWAGYAKEACEGHCYEDGSKCGVNSFSVFTECYFDEGAGFGNGAGEAPPTIIEHKPSVDVANDEPTTPEYDEGGDIDICRNSCSSEGKCYPFGYRKSGEFCLDEGKFVPQLKGGSLCENSFECTSNVCANGECISESLLKKILNWFGRVFGG